MEFNNDTKNNNLGMPINSALKSGFTEEMDQLFTSRLDLIMYSIQEKRPEKEKDKLTLEEPNIIFEKGGTTKVLNFKGAMELCRRGYDEFIEFFKKEKPSLHVCTAKEIIKEGDREKKRTILKIIDKRGKKFNHIEYKKILKKYIGEWVVCKSCGNFEHTSVEKIEKQRLFFCLNCQSEEDVMKKIPKYYLTNSNIE